MERSQQDWALAVMVFTVFCIVGAAASLVAPRKDPQARGGRLVP